MNAFWQSLKIAVTALRANKLRSLLTTLGIVIGIATVIAIVSIVEGLNDAFASELAAFGQGSLYIQKFPWASNDWQKFKNFPDIGWKEYNAVEREAKSIDGISPQTRTRQTVKWRNKKLEKIEINGANYQYAAIRGFYPVIGRNFLPLDDERSRQVCMLGHDVAEKLFGLRNPLGEHIRIGIHSFLVIGVINERGDFFDSNLDNFVLIPFSTFTGLFTGRHEGFSIIVRVTDPTKIDAAIDELTGILRRVRKLSLDKPDNFSINQIDALKSMYDKLTGGLYAAMIAVAAIALLVGGIGIMNIMLVSVTERTKEIGIRKALGARRRWILAQFLFEAAIIAGIGGVFGVALGAALAKIVAKFTPLSASVESWSVLLGVGFSCAVGIFFGLFPARAAARKNPIEALQHE
ncbi:MAG TPA: ABC transporter permease [bacterium]|nr:ABC transporter permease [bacterium]